MSINLKVIDSCGWIEFLTNDVNTGFFEPLLVDTENIIVPVICIFEVSRRVMQLFDKERVETVYRAMNELRVVQLDSKGMFDAAYASREYKLSLADAIIWQTAQAHGATLYTQDAALKGLPNVKFKAKKS